MITKKTLKKIRKGDYGALIGAIEELLGEYNEYVFDNGYKSCLSDMEVYAKKLAEKLTEEAEIINFFVKKEGETYYLLDQDETEKIISDFFTDKFNNYGRKQKLL